MERTEPDIRRLGGLALGAAVLAALFSVTYFFILLAYLAATVAVPLGLLSRGHEHSRGPGNAAIVLSIVAIVTASAMLFWA